VPVQLRLSDAQAAALDKARDEKSRSELIRHVLTEHLKAEGYLK
jgi:hypothetical protein